MLDDGAGRIERPCRRAVVSKSVQQQDIDVGDPARRFPAWPRNRSIGIASGPQREQELAVLAEHAAEALVNETLQRRHRKVGLVPGRAAVEQQTFLPGDREAVDETLRPAHRRGQRVKPLFFCPEIAGAETVEGRVLEPPRKTHRLESRLPLLLVKTVAALRRGASRRADFNPARALALLALRDPGHLRVHQPFHPSRPRSAHPRPRRSLPP